MCESKAGVGLSRKWDAREAGREVAETALEKLDGEKPKFFLLFSTIHYEKYGGFQELLNGVWEVLPEGTPLIGGTVAGFMNNYGCFARGVTALAVSYPHINVVSAMGENPKGDPEGAAIAISKKLKVAGKSSKNLIILLTSGPEIFDFPFVKEKKFIRSKKASKLAIEFMKVAQKKMGKGWAMDKTVLSLLSKEFSTDDIISGTSIDDFDFKRNYLFYMDKILTNASVALRMGGKLNFNVNTTHCMKVRGIKFAITSVDYGGHIIKEINGKPAWPEFLRLVGWSEKILLDENKFTEAMMYIPFGFPKSGYMQPTMPAFVFGDWMTAVAPVEENDSVEILYIDGELLLEAVRSNLSKQDIENPLFGIFSSCITRILTLGKNIYRVKKILSNYFQDSPYIVFYTAGEGTYSGNSKILNYCSMSFNSAIASL